MADVVTLPKLGMDMEEGTFVNWVKKVGDPVKAGDVIAEIESDKATIEIQSEFSGILLETMVESGQVVPVGAPIAKVGKPGEGSAPAPVAAPAPAKPAAAAPAASAPAGNGKMTAPAPAAPAATPAPAPAAPPEPEDATLPGGIRASPLARKLAQDRGIDLRLVKGSGPGGRITKTDVEGFKPGAPAPLAASAATARPSPAAAALAPAPTGPDIVEEPISRLRQRIATRMVESKQQVPHFYVTTEIDMAPALTLRKQINEGLPDEQKVTVNDLVVKAVALTLRQFPNLNSHYYGEKYVRHQRIHIGMAVALETGGLLNVVARDADSTAISRLAQRNKEMIARARAGKVKPEDIEGSTFTVSNLGPYEVEQFAAIINPPEAGILAVASARDVPVVINGEVKIGSRMKCTLSVDHRVSDGAEGAQFMQAFKKLLESPMRLLL